jgi:hypothetical protein
MVTNKNMATNKKNMANNKNHRIVESTNEARQAGPGPSVLAMLVASTGLAICILVALWFAFLRT